MLNPSARKGRLLTLLCFLISVQTTGDKPGFGFLCLWSIVDLISISTACRWGTRHIVSVQIKSILNEGIKTPKQQAWWCGLWHRNQLSEQNGRSHMLGFLSGWLCYHPRKSQFGSRKLRGKLKRKMLSCQPKLSAGSTKKHAVCARTMYSLYNEVSSQQNVIS